ncbi:MAG: ferredoxin--NADP reductase [Acidobacteriota bacterium]|nr:ferredoxin--NADP reductase [Acidobacteriota bacterium]
MAPKELVYNATLVDRVDYTPSLSVFKVQLDPGLEPPAPRFLAGQYVVLGLNNEEVPELGSVRRPMSIVSAPEETGSLEFYIRFVSHPESDNPLTHLLWKLKPGARLFCGTRITGRFTLQDTIGDGDPRIKVMVAAGTGLAPFLSFVRSEVLRNPAADLSQYVMLHGASYPADLGYREELFQLRDQHGLHYFSTVSRPKEAPDWTGDQGRVEDYFLPERLAEMETRLGLPPGGFDAATAVIFICGLQGTIGQTFLRLVERGFVPENRRLRRALEVPEGAAASLFFEQYDTNPVIDLKDENLVRDVREKLHGALQKSS